MKKILTLLIMALSIGVIAGQLPSTFQVQSGKVKIQLEKKVFWNLDGLWYNGKQIAQSKKGFWGTVTNQTGSGWVGTGHLENKIGETNLKVEFFLDGKKWNPVAGVTKGNSFEMKKTSTLLAFDLIYNIKLENNTLYEFVEIKATKDVESRLYNFMHPFSSDFTEYYFTSNSKPVQKGTFSNEKAENITIISPKDFVIYAPNLKLAVVSKLNKLKSYDKWDRWLLWNRKFDRKFYYVVTYKNMFKKDVSYSWELTTSFVETENDDLSLLIK